MTRCPDLPDCLEVFVRVQGDAVAVTVLLGAKWRLEDEEKELRDRSNRRAVKKMEKVAKFPRWREQMQKL